MNDLKALNLERSVSVVTDFIDTVAVEDENYELSKKKHDALKALEHIDRLFHLDVKGSTPPPCSCSPSDQSCSNGNS